MKVSCPHCEQQVEFDPAGNAPANCGGCGYEFYPSAIMDAEDLAELKNGSRPRTLPGSGVVPGQRMGRYEIIEEIGRGGMAVACRARDISCGLIVALKLLPPQMHSSKDHVNAFLREADVVQRLRHRGLAPVLEVGCHGGRYYFAMEHVEGSSLDEVIERGRLLPEEAARIVAEAARAVGTAHRAGVIHRDIKPKNIMVAPDGRAVVLDFGLSSLWGQPDENEGRIVGTPAYISPEQARAGRGEPVGPASDIYSLGAVLYEAVTGQPPYSGVDGPSIVARVLRSSPPPPRTFSPGLSPRLEGIILKAMARKPAVRYANAAELAEDLERFRVGDSVRARKPGLGTGLRSGIWKVRHRVGRWALPAVCIAIGLILLVYLLVLTVLYWTGWS
ncbi:MAG: serine/threonine-protein kinase [Planctomycetota bacterium]